MEERYRLIGGPGSLYSLKIRALMRYRRLPFDWLIRARVADEVAHVKPPTIPILHTPSNDHYQSDSTPIVDYLEQRHPGQRSVIPDDPAMAFLNFMLEDMSDEWATKFMYQQRWLDPADQEFYGHYLGWFREGTGPWDEVAAYGSRMRYRQVSRNALVGVSPANRPVIDRTFKLVMGAFEKLASEIRRTMKLVIDGIDDMPGGEEAVQRNLRRSLSGLRDILTRLPADRLTEAELVAEQAKV
jgi:hypothetical protein